jgi:hypothetical protein
MRYILGQYNFLESDIVEPKENILEFLRYAYIVLIYFWRIHEKESIYKNSPLASPFLSVLSPICKTSRIGFSLNII